MANLKVGDVVTLKSGGPDMTITRANGDNWNCEWFNNGKLEARMYYADSLTISGQPFEGPPIAQYLASLSDEELSALYEKHLTDEELKAMFEKRFGRQA